MPYSKNTTNGFTLLEMLLYISIASIILFVMVSFAIGAYESKVKNQVVLEVETQGAAIMERILSTTRASDAIISPATSTSADSLSLTMASSTLNPTIFSLQLGALKVSENSSTTMSLTNNRVTVSNLIFYNYSRANTPGVVSIQFTISGINTSGRNEYNYSKTFYGTASLR